ncbi:MAG TPA: crosslink repair DNA glycosylase YcaQ family protein [Acidothermaceae bacterium]
MAALELSANDARRIALRAQSLLGAPDRRAGVPGVLRALGAVQLDTISVLARSHELVVHARLGVTSRVRIERAYWGSGDAFEYWAHAASVLPISQWPLFAFRRREFRERQRVWDDHHAPTAEKVLARVRAEGPLTASDLGGAKQAAQWWGWSEVKRAAEYLLAAGELVCATRVGWRRVYDLPERVVPSHWLHDDMDDDRCKVELIRRAARALGVATAADLADYFRLRTRDVVRLLPETELTSVAVAGWRSPAWADPAALEAAAARGRHRSTLLSPFDSLVWDRKRTARLFGFDHRLEAYVPKGNREHGYFTMPVLAGGSLIARVDPARENGVLVARQITVEPRFATPARIGAAAASIATALREAAQWVGCDGVAVDRVVPEPVDQLVRAAL